MTHLIPILTFFASLYFLPGGSLFGQIMDARVNRDVRRDVIDRVGRLLASNYVDSIKGAEAGEFLQQRFNTRAYLSFDHPRALAETLTADLQKFLGDNHVRIRELSLAEQQSRKENPIFTLLFDSYIKYATNYGLRELKLFPGNIGYLALDSFEPLEQVRHKIVLAMSFLADVNTLIIDLRENTGGNLETVQFLCSYFFEKPVHLNNQYWRRGNYIEEFWTRDNIGTTKQHTIPLFILTSRRTFSAAEEFVYNLKTLQRAKIVGEKTAGGANPGYSFPVSDRFVIFIPTGRPINPLTGTNWEGTGVEPDTKISADRALDVALGQATVEAQRLGENQDKTAIRGFLDLSQKLNDTDREESDTARTNINSSLSNAYKQNWIDESIINALGYYYLNKRRINSALVIFQFNVHTFPNSANVFDSLAEAYYKKGDREKAVANYNKSLEINPQNQNARHMLRILHKMDN